MEQSQGAGRQLPAPSDPYQARYLAHQARKREVLLGIMRERHSSRMFADQPPAAEVLEDVLENELPGLLRAIESVLSDPKAS